MKTILLSGTLLLTISLALALGIGAAYIVIAGILRAFGHRPAKQIPPSAPAIPQAS